jgi:hypothetical protein
VKGLGEFHQANDFEKEGKLSIQRRTKALTVKGPGEFHQARGQIPTFANNLLA